MKNYYLFYCLFGSMMLLPLTTSSQCPITVNAGEDIFICNPPQDVQLNGELNGDVLEFHWSPVADFLQPDVLSPMVTVGQPKSLIFKAKAWNENENLVINGDFEQGNTGFVSHLLYSPFNLVPLGRYDVLPDPEAANDAFNPCDDHTSGGGNMMAISFPHETRTIWSQVVYLTPNTDYKFSFWATNLLGPQREIRIHFSDVPVAEWLVPEGCGWGQYITEFNSGQNQFVVLQIKCHKSQVSDGSAAIDDIALVAKCEVSDSVKVNVVDFTATASPVNYNITCAGNNVTLHGTGSSTGPGITYHWETQNGNIVSGENTLHPVVNAPGTYTLTVSLENVVGDCSKSVSVLVTENNPLQASILAPPSLNCTGQTILTGQSNFPAFSTYQWTASAGGNIVSGTNNPNAIVNQPGTYTLLVTNTATGCSKVASVNVAAPQLPSVFIQSPGTLSSSTDTLTLSATVSPSNATLLWTTPDSNIVFGANTLNPLITAPGTYILTATNPATGCKTVDSIQVSKAGDCGLTVDAGEDVKLCGPHTPYNLNGSVDGPYYDIKWSPVPPLVDPGSLQSSVNVSQTTNFVLTVRTVEPSYNLIVNPDFEQGNVGFSSDYVYSPGNLTMLGSYDVLTNPQSANDAFPACGDHTSGSGNMLAAIVQSYSDDVWCQTVPVTPFTDYYFSYWGTRIEVGPTPAILTPWINSYTFLPMTIPSYVPECEWKNVNGVWNSHIYTTANICIRLAKYAVPIALDDIYFGPFCYETDTMTIFVKDMKAVATPSLYTLPCEGFNLTLSGAGSSVGPDYSYQWETPDGNIVSGQNTLNPVVNAPGTYTLTVSIENGIGDNCSETASVEVVNLNQPQVSITAPPNLACGSNATLTGSSSQPASSVYQWTASQGGNIVSGNNGSVAVVNQPGTYTLLVTNSVTGCTAEESVVIGGPALPTAVASAPPITCASPQTTLSGAGSANGPTITYAWSTANGNIVSGQDSLYAVADTAGIYVLLVTNTSNGCSKTDTVVVKNNTSALSVSILPADSITCLQANVILATDSTTAGMHRVYAWTAIAGGNIVSGGDSLSPVVNAPGLYVLLVTDTLNACTGTDTIAVAADNDAVIAIANAPDVITCSVASVTLNADGSSAMSSLIYLWSTSDGHIVSGGNTLNPTVNAPGIYTLLLTNPANGCSATDIAEVTQNTVPPPVSILPPAPLSCSLPLLVLQGQNAALAGSFFYDWTAANGGHIVAGDSTLMLCVDAGGTYTLHATNLDNGCTSSTTVDVSTDFAAPDLSLSVSGPLNCHAVSVNLLNNSTTDPSLLNHEWTLPDGSGVNTGSNPTLNTNQAGNYTLLLSNTQNGCTSTATATVVQHDDVSAALAAQQNATCFGAANGSLSITANGGDGAYTYLWSNGDTTPAIDELAADIYTVTITDGENCSATFTATVSQPAELLANASATPISVIGASDGTATANPQGGVSPYGFHWSNDETTPLIVGLSAGFYTVTITDTNGCTAVQTVQVWDGECNLLADFQTISPLCNGQASGQATVLPSGGSAPFTYLWTSGSTEQTATDLAAGTYSVTVTDANDCPFTGDITLTEPPALTLTTINIVNTDCPASPEGSATAFAAGGVGTINISWSNGQNGPTAINLAAGTYTATATDANGCSATTTASIQAIDQEAPVIQVNATTVPLGSTGAVTLTPQMLGVLLSDNCSVATIQITPDEFDCFDLGEQQVTITAQDESGNISTQVVEVTVVDVEAPVLECPANIVRCHGNNIVEYPAPVAIDNCLILGGTFDLTEGLPSGSPFPQGTTNNAYTYTDVSGNMGACSFQITILSPLNVSLDAIKHDVAGQHIGAIQVTVGGSMPGYSYEWLLNGQVIATTEDLSGIGMGLYTLLVTDANGCTAQAGPYEVTSLVHTASPDWATGIAVFPNPSKGVVFVMLPDELVNAEVHFTAFDATGRKVLEQLGSREKRAMLDLSDVPAGLYSLLIRTGQSQAMWKIVINR